MTRKGQYVKAEKNNDGRHYEVNLETIPRASTRGHLFRQRGTALVCTSCNHEHAIYISPGHIYKGNNNDGLPIIEKRSIKSS